MFDIVKKVKLTQVATGEPQKLNLRRNHFTKEKFRICFNMFKYISRIFQMRFEFLKIL